MCVKRERKPEYLRKAVCGGFARRQEPAGKDIFLN